MGSLIGLCWLVATALLASAGYQHLRGNHTRAAQARARAGWLAAAAVVSTLITIAAGSL
jgi:hypothetical protein